MSIAPNYTFLQVLAPADRAAFMRECPEIKPMLYSQWLAIMRDLRLSMDYVVCASESMLAIDPAMKKIMNPRLKNRLQWLWTLRAATENEPRTCIQQMVHVFCTKPPKTKYLVVVDDTLVEIDRSHFSQIMQISYNGHFDIKNVVLK